HDRRFPFAVLDLDEGQPFRAEGLCDFSQLVGLTYGERCKVLGVDRFYDAAGVERAAKYLKTACLKILTKIDKLHSETAIGLVAAKPADGFAIGQPIERRLDVDIARRLEDRRQHSL